MSAQNGSSRSTVAQRAAVEQNMYNIIAAHLTDTFYNGLYGRALARVNNGESQSIQEAYRVLLANYLRGLTKPEHCETTLKHIHGIHNRVQPYMSLSHFLETMLQCFHPSDVIEPMTDGEAQRALNDSLRSVANMAVKYVLTPRVFKSIIDDHSNAENIQDLKHTFAEYCVVQREQNNLEASKIDNNVTVNAMTLTNATRQIRTLENTVSKLQEDIRRYSAALSATWTQLEEHKAQLTAQIQTSERLMQLLKATNGAQMSGSASRHNPLRTPDMLTQLAPNVRSSPVRNSPPPVGDSRVRSPSIREALVSGSPIATNSGNLRRTPRESPSIQALSARLSASATHRERSVGAILKSSPPPAAPPVREQTPVAEEQPPVADDADIFAVRTTRSALDEIMSYALVGDEDDLAAVDRLNDTDAPDDDASLAADTNTPATATGATIKDLPASGVAVTAPSATSVAVTAPLVSVGSAPLVTGGALTAPKAEGAAAAETNWFSVDEW